MYKEQNSSINWYAIPSQEAMDIVDTNKNGLTEEEAEKRRESFGANALPAKEPPGLISIFFRQFLNPLIYILVAAAIASTLIGKGRDALFIFAVLFFNASVGMYQEYNAEKSSAALLKLLKLHSRIRRDGKEREIDAEDLVPGDVVLLESGNRVPADLRLIDTNSLLIDESLLTGESAAIEKDPRTLPSQTSLGDRVNMAFAGSAVSSGRGTGVVVATGIHSEVGKIAKAVTSGATSKPPLIIRMEAFTRQLGIVIVTACMALGVFELFKGEPAQQVFLMVVALAVSAIPEGLPVAMTVALSIATRRMSQRNVIVRQLAAVEGLGSCTLIASDKTGTLTLNKQTIKKLFLYPDYELTVEGEGYNDIGRVLDAANHPVDPVLNKELHEMGKVAIIANEGSFHRDGDSWQASGDAVDIAFLALGYKLGLKPEEVLRQIEVLVTVPFESERKYSARFYREGDQIKVAVKGAAEAVIPMSVCDWDQDRVCGLFDPKVAEEETHRLSALGFRVLALAVGQVEEREDRNYTAKDIKNLSFLGLAGLIDPLRPEAKTAVELCRQAGVRVIMITGDHPATALAIGKNLGISQQDSNMISGPELIELAKISKHQYLDRIEKISVFARVTPLQKLEIVKALMERGHFVAVTGDGANDAPALRTANIGVAMGSGTDLAKESANIIAADDNFASIVAGVEEGRYAYYNVRRVILFLITTGAGLIVFFTAALFSGLPLPLVAVQLLWLNLVANGFQDVALAFEAGDPEAMREKPRNPKDGIFDKRMITQVSIIGLTLAILCFGYWSWLNAVGIPLDEARSRILLLLIFMGNLHVLNCRSERTSIFKVPVKRNPLVVSGVVLTHALHVLLSQIPFAQEILYIEPITLDVWLTSLLLALPVLLVMEVYKWVTAISQQEIH